MAKIIVVGGSLGGLLVANLLHRSGHDVQLLEKASQALDARGAGIVTHPPLVDALHRAGVPRDAEMGVRVTERVTLNVSGEVASVIELPQVLTSWGRLYSQLRAALPDARYHTGVELTNVEQANAGVIAHTSRGVFQGELLIASDGLRSTVRQQFAPEIQPCYAGYFAWRGVCDEASLSKRTRDTLFGRFGFGLPDGEQMIGYPVAGAQHSTVVGERRYNFVWYRSAPEAELIELLTDADSNYYPTGIPPHRVNWRKVHQMRHDAQTILAPQFAEIVEKTAQPFLQAIYDVSSTQIAFGRVALMGDASFVARPHVGAGVTKAAADALALVESIAEAGATPAGLERYQDVRLIAGQETVQRGRDLGRYMQAQSTVNGRSEPREVERVMRDTATLWF
ncbi:MAG: FAD binding domain-containing protein [Burkholderiales bacterium]|nr:FAD binding domain-containing protein [Burkholderiales bacterium]